MHRWNPSRLEQRKGRIQRIGQVRPEVDVYNMRYAGSVEDRVHELLSERLESISRLFGQLPDTLEDVWVQVALGQAENAKRTIDAVPQKHPFELRYREVRHVDWESCARVLDDAARREALARGWQSASQPGCRVDVTRSSYTAGAAVSASGRTPSSSGPARP